MGAEGVVGLRPVKVGVLALQGAFAEHVTMLEAEIAAGRVAGGVTFEPKVAEVRTREELEAVDALVIPGGESTAMANLAERWQLMDPLREFIASKPCWGTCAGMIFLANRIHGAKEGGQVVLGGMDIEVHRNFFGAQINSFQTRLDAPSCFGADGEGGDDAFTAVFIRAPAILLDGGSAGDGVEVLSTLEVANEVEVGPGRKVKQVAVAARQGTMLVTAFHPELTSDTRWHRLFLRGASDHFGTNAAQLGKGKGMGGSKEAQTLLPLVEKMKLPVHTQ